MYSFPSVRWAILVDCVYINDQDFLILEAKAPRKKKLYLTIFMDWTGVEKNVYKIYDPV